MSDLLEFVISLKNMTKPTLGEIGNGFKSTFDGMDKSVGNTQNNLNSLGRTVKLHVDSRDVERATKEVSGLHSAMKLVTASFAGQLAARGVSEGLRQVKELGESAIDKGFETERQIVGLSTFVGDQKAKDIYEGLQKQAVMTPFQTSDMLPIEMGLIATGMTPERANKDMMNLMNAVASTGGNEAMLSLMGMHLAQAASGGKIDGQLLREFQKTAHIPVERLIADDLFPHLSHAAGLKKVQNMDTVTYDQFSHALERASQAGGLFAGGMEKLSVTMSGKWSTIKDFWGIGLSKLTMSQHDNIIKLEDQLISGLSKFPELIANLTPSVGRLFDDLNALWPSIREFGGALIDLLKPIGNLLLSDSSITLFKNALDLATTALNKLAPVAEFISGTIGVLVTEINQDVQDLKNDFNYLFDRDQYDRDNDPDTKTGEKKGYIWGDIPLGYKQAGFVVDSAKFKQINDSLIKNDLLYKDQAQLSGYRDYFQKNYPKINFIDGGKVPIPMMKPNKAKGMKPKVKTGADEASENIIRGGSRVINVNIKSFVEHMNNTFSSAKDGLDFTEAKFVEFLLRAVESAKQAM